MNSKKRILSLLMAVVMLCSLVVTASAEEVCDHNYKETVLKAPTCDATGVSKFVCTICNDSYYAATQASHTRPAEGIEKVEPTCTESGFEAYICASCGEKVERIIPATGEHKFAESIKDATCTTNTLVGQICSVCGLVNGEAEELPGTALGHKWDAGKYVAPTCDKDGYVLITCASCGETKEEPTGLEDDKALGHDYKSVVTAATCAAGGYTTYTCANCGAEYTADETEIDPNAHSYKENILKAATCEKSGVMKLICADCGDSKYESIPAGHAFVENGILKAPTCTEAGELSLICSACGAEDKLPIDMIAHNYVADQLVEGSSCVDNMIIASVCSMCGAVEEGTAEEVPGTANGHDVEEVIEDATCDAPGKVTEICKVCKEILSEGEIPALGHDWDDGVLVDADCVNGQIVLYTCRTCGETKSEETGVEGALGHKYEAEVIAPTCASKGCTKHTCSVCGDSYTDSETEIDPSAHKNSENVLKAATCEKSGVKKLVCDLCGVSSYAAIPAGHSYDEGVVTQESTCTVEGVKTYTCSKCQGTKTEAIPAGHEFVEITVLEPTCGAEGSKMQVCLICDLESEPIVIPATGKHSYAESIQDATCTDPEMVCFLCTVCGAEDPDRAPTVVAPELGHNWGDDPAYVAPTCIEDGYWLYTCTVCGEEKDREYTGLEEDKALGHDYKSVVTAATCAAGGYTTYTCANCGDEYIADETPVDPEAHTYKKDLLKAATCEKSGVQKLTCKDCGIYSYTAIPAGHNWTDKEISKPATCGADGEKIQICSVCGEEQKVAIAATGKHNYVEAVLEDATCESPAVVAKICSVCKAEEAGSRVEVGEILEHQEATRTEAADCEKDGKDIIYCALCEAVLDEIVIPATGHSLNAGELKDADCENAQRMEYKCTKCDYVKVEETGLQAALGHDYKDVVTAPTCQKEGYTTHTCSRCGDSYKDSETAIDPDNHAFTYTNLREATCTSSGIRKAACACGEYRYEAYTAPHAWGEDQVSEDGSYIYRVCGSCQKQELLECLSHNLDVKTDKEATCTEDGQITMTCINPGCGFSESSVVNAAGHSFGDETVAEDNSHTYCECAVCGEIEIIACLEHSFVDGVCEYCGGAEPVPPTTEPVEPTEPAA